MSLFFYQDLLSPYLDVVCEDSQGYSLLTERHVQALWLEQKYFNKLYTTGGEEIIVVSPGIWNTEAGPDFLKAHIWIGAKEWRGDVEIHLVDEGWDHHKHHLDERYNQVILHLAFWPSKRAKPLYTKDGREISRTYLERALNLSMEQILSFIDLDLYPYKEFIGSGRCASLLFNGLSERQARELFSSAAEWRLEQKKKDLALHFPTVSMQFRGGLARALGYKNNGQTFLELFQFLLPYRDLPEPMIIAMALGCCGIFEEGTKSEWKASPYYGYLQGLWGGEREKILYQGQLKLDHIRPFNHPIRRIIYLIKMLRDPHIEGLWSQLINRWNEGSSQGCDQLKAVRRLRQSLLALIPSYEDSYWNTHYLFEIEPQKAFLPLMGENLKVEILINVFLPLLYHEIKEQGAMVQIFKLLFHDLKANVTGKNRYLTQRFFGDSAKGAILKEAQMAQGAYQLHKDFCIHFEASCEGCPFVERYLSYTKTDLFNKWNT